MGYETGAVKYFIGVLLTPVGFVSMYLFGDAIWNTVQHFDALLQALTADTLGEVVVGILLVYIPTPGSVLGSLVVYPVVGCGVATVLWYTNSKP